MTQELLNLIPDELKQISGSVFYSGPEAFIGNKPLYILGLNPGGQPTKKVHQTLDYHTDKNIKNNNWSEYRDVSWDGSQKGTSGLQPRVLHLLNKLNLNPSEIPASNVVFVRTKTENELKGKFQYYADLCWPFHEYVIYNQKIKNILCFGLTGGNYVRNKLKADIKIDEYIETNNRNWKTRVFRNVNGLKVIIATHPSRANWCNPNSDPSKMIKKYIYSP